MEKYKIGQQIGSGSQGVVMTVFKETKAGQLHIKAMKRIRFNSIDEVNKALQEMQMVLQLEHSHMVAYEELFFDQVIQQGLNIHGEPIENIEEYICIVMPYFINKDLEHFVQQHKAATKKPLPQGLILEMMRQLCDFMTYFHSKGMIHRDLKPQNILVANLSNDSSSPSSSSRIVLESTNQPFDFTRVPLSFSLKVADFGLSTSFSKESLRSTTCGSPYYMAPEILTSAYASPVDMFSLGCLLVYLLSEKELPWYTHISNSTKKTHVFSQFSKLLHLRGHSQAWYPLVEKLLVEDPKARLKAFEMQALLDEVEQSIKHLSLQKSPSQPFPHYWTHHADQHFAKVLDVTTLLKSVMQKVFVDCCNSKTLGSGRDQLSPMTYSSLVVSRIFRIENAHLWTSYMECANQLASSTMPFVETSVLTDANAMPFQLLHALNEKMLFHGTKPNAVDLICEQGFDVRQSTTRHLYFAEYCSRSDQYVHPNYSGEYPMFLSRVLLGHDPQKNSTILREPHALYRDFIIQHSTQAYPEFLIWYKRE